jgi:superfamily II DNA or RNA helicase
MTNEISLRNYQNKVVNEIRENLKLGYLHLLVQLPTGGGKTVIFSYMAIKSAAKAKKVMILTDREELLKQAGGSIGKFGEKCYFIKAGSKFIDHRKNIYVAMSQTLRNRIKIPLWRDFILNDIDLIIIDEAHIQEFNYIFESGLLDKKMVLGFTATPSRGGKMRQLGLDYERLIRGGEVKELIDLGYLLNCDIYECEAPDMSGVGINPLSGDYSESQMFNRYNTAKLYQGLVANYKKHTPDKKMIVFCCNVEHAIRTTIELNKAGVSAKFVSSEISEPKKPNYNGNLFDETIKEEDRAELAKYEEKLEKYKFFKENYPLYSGTRKEMFDGFKNNDFKVLVNVDIATKGYDEPSIEVVAVYRATNSLTLWLQMLGRGSRIFEGKDSFTVMDFGGNKQRLGGYDDMREWSLWHETRKDGAGVPPLKECGIDANGKAIKSSNSIEKGCKRLIMASQMICPFCGFKYPNKKEAAEVELVLSQIKDEQGVSLAVKSFKEMNFDELEIYRSSKKHKPAWLWRQLWNRGGEEELRKFAENKKWSKEVTKKAINYCNSVLNH